MLNIGPQHPATHGVLRVVVTMDGEVVKEVVPHIGYVHRGLEKLFENRLYEQIIPFTDRTDYLSAIANNFAYVMAVERLLGLEVPPKVEYTRVMAAELNRIASHLLWLAAYGLDMGAFTPFLYAFRDREEIGSMIEEASGGRLTTNYSRIGGFAYELPKDIFGKLGKFLSHFERKIDEYDTLLIENAIFVARTRGVGVISRERAISYGMSGPCLRASNAALDVRRDIPYSIYPKLSFDIPTGRNGDTWDRSKVRIEEMRQSVRILRQVLDGFPQGAVKVRAPRSIEPPPGETYAAVEGPRGEVGFYVVSDGSRKPYRIKMRKPSFSNFSAMPEILRGLKIADLVAVMGSLDLVVPEIDR
ncbi:MAG TPA: NADH-quinone oxidoreductase subunit D [Spirochaetia bacterium]|nr:NADH-quinone oxidoreductase subunit D [Spirochaetia bacterium]